MISLILISKTSKINMSIDIDGDREGTRPHPSVDNWIKDLQHALPTRGRPSFPHSQSLQSESLHKPLILIIRGQTEEAKTIFPQSPERKPQSQKANQ